MINLKKIEEDIEKKSIRRGLAIGIGAFFGILMATSLIKAGFSVRPILNTVFGVVEGLVMIMFIATSQSRR